MTDQLDFFSILDRVEIPNSAKPWCKSWLCALTNDVGVYVTNVHTYTMGEGYMAYLELKCALLYPYVYYACSLQNRMAGRGSPLTQDPECCFTVFDNLDQIEAKVTDYLEKCSSGYELKPGWIKSVVADMLKDIQQQS